MIATVTFLDGTRETTEPTLTGMDENDMTVYVLQVARQLEDIRCVDLDVFPGRTTLRIERKTSFASRFRKWVTE